MNRIIYISTVFILALGVISCDRIRSKSQRIADQVKDKAKEELKTQAKKVVEKVYPPFDHDQPDTENNKQRFKDFIKVEITPDVRNIYCFDEAIGFDASYMFAFNCSPETSKKIIEVHVLAIDRDGDNGFGLQQEFAWWDKNKIENLQKYSWTDDSQHYKYYWYDEQEEKAYFFDFDL